MPALVEIPALRVCRAFLLAGRFRLPFLLFQRLLPMRLTVLCDLFLQFLLVSPRGFFYLTVPVPVAVRACLDMRAVNEELLLVNEAAGVCFRENAFEYLFEQVRPLEPADVILAERGEVRDLLIHPIAKEPAVRDIDFDLRDRPAHGPDAEQVLEKGDLDKHGRVNAFPPERAVHVLNKSVNKREVDRLVNLAHQMLRRNEPVKARELHL